ncbi:MAG TPA: AzlD domain-containing protein [Candidatus Limnocylindrales bacterium]|nr:AzlD domain-containing protein [Candidatus Limnocylindrales bacterium]
MSTALVPLALLMGLVTYPWRTIPLLVPGMQRLPPRVQLYLRLVGPSVLAALAAVNVMVVLDPQRRASFHVGVEWPAVALCLALVAWRRNLFVGLIAAAALVGVARALGLA